MNAFSARRGVPGRICALASLSVAGVFGVAPGVWAQAAEPAPATTPTATPTQVRWHLIGTGPDGRSLVIHEFRTGQCGADVPRRPVVVEATADRIVLRIDEPPSDPNRPPELQVCPENRELPQFVTVPVGVPIAGQRIEGGGRVASNKKWDLRREAELLTTPRLIGLRIPDAIGVLRDLGIPKSKVRFDGPRRGRVVGQSPAATKTRTEPADRFTLRTKPAVSGGSSPSSPTVN